MIQRLITARFSRGAWRSGADGRCLTGASRRQATLHLRRRDRTQRGKEVPRNGRFLQKSTVVKLSAWSLKRLMRIAKYQPSLPPRTRAIFEIKFQPQYGRLDYQNPPFWYTMHVLTNGRRPQDAHGNRYV